MRLKNDIFKFWALIALAVIIVYFTLSVLNWIFFITIIYLFLNKNRYEYFWIALWFVFMNAPGDLFELSSSSDLLQIPFVRISVAGIISLIQIIPLIFLIKSFFSQEKRSKIILKSDFIFFFIMMAFYFVLSFAYGISVNSIFNTVFIFINWTFLFSLPRLLSFKTIEYLDRLLFSVIIVAFISQLFALFIGDRWLDLLKITNYYLKDATMIQKDVIARVISSPFIILYGMHKAIYYSFSKRYTFSKSYLSFIIFISVFSILLSATRGWIIAVAFTLLLVLLNFRSVTGFKRVFSLVIIGGFILLLVIFMFPRLSILITQSFDRMSSLEKLAEGDLSMGGELVRVTERAPRVLKPFYEKPYFGWAFSNIYWGNRDKHVGHPVMLLNLGIIGYILMMLLILKWFFRMFYLPQKNYFLFQIDGQSSRVLSFGILFILIVHSTSVMFWGFELDTVQVLTIALLLTSYNVLEIANTESFSEFKNDH